MAESERLKGNRPPVADYKIGNGGVRDLLRYILGDEETRGNMKIVKTVKNKKTVVKDTNQKNAIVSKVARVMDSNKVSLLAGEEAARKSNRMASVVNQRPTRERITGADISNRLKMAATYPPNMYNNTNNNTNEFGSVVVPSPGEVTVEEMPESEEDLMERLNKEFIPDITNDPIRRRISKQEQTLIDDKENMYFLDQGYIPQAMAYGGEVENKKKKKKKLARGGKVTSYNY